MEQNKKNVENQKEARNILDQYKAQNEENENVHFEHYDWTYNDSSCCC